MIELVGIGRTYGGATPVEALHSIDLVVEAGEYVAIVGASGSGKSTLLHVLGLLEEPTAGEYRLGGAETAGLGEGDRAGFRAHQIGFVFQAFHLVKHLTVRENVELGLTYQGVGRAERRRRATMTLHQVGLGHRLDAFPSELSGGERQRVAVARAVVRRPALLLCDEPTGNLDSVTTAAVLELFDGLHASGLTVVVITHDPVVAQRAGRTVALADGTVLGDRTVSSGIVPMDVPPRLPAHGRARLALVDVAREALAAIARRLARSLLTGLGTAVGVGALVAITGLAATLAAQVGETFDALAATEVRARDGSPDGSGEMIFTADPEPRLGRLNGVRHAGMLADVVSPLRPRAHPAADVAPGDGLAVVAISPGALRAARAEVATGVLFDPFHYERAERVVVLGRAAAAALGITRVDHQPAVFLGDVGYTVVGIVDDVERSPRLLSAVMVPTTTARAAAWSIVGEEVLVDVDPGAAQLVGSQLARALRPQQPERVQVLVPPDPRTLRAGIESDVASLFYGLAGLALVVGMIGIANTTLVAVMERQSEIGIRRALGARGRHILSQFLTEAAVLGGVGGIMGTAAGIVVVVAVSAAQEWTATVEVLVPLTAPFLGVVTGLVAGLYPSLRAARLAPARALRGTTL